MNDDYVEVSEKEIASVTEATIAVDIVARGDFILVNLARKRAFFIRQLK
jgi:hypothetical protein